VHPKFLLGGLEGATFICPSPIFLKHWALPKIEACMWFPSAELYSFIYESSTFAIVYGIKVWEYFGNTFWKLDGNTLGTEKTKLLSPPFQNLKDKNFALLSACSPSHWPHENYGPKTVCHHFQLGPMSMCTY